MKDELKTKEQLINELVELRQRITELEASETEGKRVEEALWEREAHLQAVFEAAANISFVTMDLTGTESRILDFSPGAERIFGYSREEVIGKPVAMLHLPEDMARLPEVFEAMRQSKSGFTGESTLVHKSGEEFPTLFTIYPIFDAEGNMPATLSVSIDITERKRAEEALRESEERFREVFEHSQDALYKRNLETGRYEYISPAITKITGYSPDEVMAMSPDEIGALIHPEDIERINDLRRNVFEAPQGHEIISPIEYRVKCKDGSYRWISDHYALLWGPEGRPLFSVASVRDIAERKRAEEALRESEERFRTIVETAPSLLLITDAKGNNIYVSPNCEEITGYTQEELQGPLVWWVHEDDTPRAKEVYDRTFREGVGYKDLEYKAVKKDGELWYGSSSWEPFRDAEGKLQGIVFQTTDIAERKRVEEALRESEERFRAIFERAAIGMSLADREGRYIETNRALQKMLGYGEEELRSMAFTEITYPDDAKADMAFHEDLIAGKLDHFQTEKRYIRKDGRLVWVRLTVSAIRDVGGEVQYDIGMVEDITERKRAEEALRESEERYRAVVESQTELIGRWRPDGTLTFVNEAYCRYHGKSREELIGHKWTMHVAEEDQARVKAYAEHLVTSLSPANATVMDEHRRVTADGRIRWQQWTDQALFDEQGHLVEFQSVGHDITERKRAEEALRRRNRELALLNRAGQAFSSTLDLDQVLVTVLEEARRLLDVVACSVWLIEPKTEELVCRQAVGPQSEIVRGWRLAPGEGLAGWVARSGESLIVPDTRADERHFKDVDRQTGLALRSIVSVPLQVKEDVIGVIQVVDTEVGRFSPADLTLLEPLATAAAIAIENARLFQKSQRRTEEMAALRQVNLATLSSLERHQVFEIMLEQLGTVIDYDTAAIKVITPDGKDKMVAGRGPVIHDEVMWYGFDAKDNKLVQEMKETRRPVVVHDTHTDERYEQVGNWEMFRSWAGSPLFVKDDLIGYLAVEKTSPGFYDEIAIQLLGDFAHAAAIALENARLYEQARRDAETRAVLLREVNHRVQNNLTAIIGLLYAARRRAGMEDQAVYQSIMQDLVNRVQGLSTVHSLFSASGWAPLPLSRLATQVIDSSLRMLPRSKRVSVEVSPSPLRVTPDQAHNLALVVNELATNTAKHTLWERNTAHITVRIALEDDTVLFEFRDDGPGYPEEVLQLERHDVGLDLIQNMVRKGLRGELSLHNDHGAVAVIQFKAKA
jgi:PAS domain S-box-containing protein